jgi:hypothetical protein
VLDAHYNTGRGVRFLQQALNHLNWQPRGLLWPHLVEDGSMGKMTWGALMVCWSHPRRGPKLLATVQNACQARYYLEIQERNERFEKYVGWWSRVDQAAPPGYPTPDLYYRWVVHTPDR